MIIIGLTGSIATGKSFVANIFRKHRIPVFDADQEVQKLLSPEGKALPKIMAAFPEAVSEGRVDKKKLGQIVFRDVTALQLLERILHPLVEKKTRRIFT